MQKLLCIVVVVFSIFSCTENKNVINPDKDYSSSLAGTLRFIPAGQFYRTAEEEDVSYVDEFHISTKEITHAQFEKIMADYTNTHLFNDDNHPDHPQMASWYQILVFCNFLSIKENLDCVYSIYDSTDPVTWMEKTGGIPVKRNYQWDRPEANWNNNGYRMPTEMEWLWAARAGYSEFDLQMLEFAGSNGQNNIDDYAWTLNNSKASSPVGRKKPNGSGLYDMSGNILEWVWDFGGVWPRGRLDNYKGPGFSGHHVLLGGSWRNPAYASAINFRNENHPYFLIENYGFRIVRNIL